MNRAARTTLSLFVSDTCTLSSAILSEKLQPEGLLSVLLLDNCRLISTSFDTPVAGLGSANRFNRLLGR